MEMPEVQVIEFEAKDVIVTSGGDMGGEFNPFGVQERHGGAFED